MPKPPVDIRAMIDVRKFAVGPAHSGSALMNPVTPMSTLNNAIRSFTWSVNPQSVAGVHGPCLYMDKSIIQIDCGAVGGTATFNVEIRTAYDSSGTDAMGSDQVADNAGETVTSFVAPDGLKGNWFYLDISAFDAGTTELTVTVHCK